MAPTKHILLFYVHFQSVLFTYIHVSRNFSVEVRSPYLNLNVILWCMQKLSGLALKLVMTVILTIVKCLYILLFTHVHLFVSQ